MARAAEIDGSVAAYHVGLGLVREREGELAAAASHYSSAIAATPGAVDSDFRLDLKQRNPNLWQTCVMKAVERLRSRDPEGRDSVNEASLARLYIEQGNLAAASRILDHVTSSMPQLPRPWANLGYVEFIRGNTEGALRKSLFLDTAYCPAQTLFALIQRNAGNENAAVNIGGSCEMGVIQRMSRHAARVHRLYKLKGTVVVDDVLPPGILACCEPRSFPH
jgi:tetratricopeptide (TPR) repeat protein